MKILLCGTETAGILNSISQGFKELGVELIVAGRNPAKKFYSTKFDIDLDSFSIDDRVQLFIKCIEWADIVFYINASGFFVHPNFDYAEIKKRKKTLGVYATGSDTRVYSTHIKILEKIGVDISQSRLQNRITADNYALSFLKLAEKYADIIISTPDQSYHSEREFFVGYQPFILSTLKDRHIQNEFKSAIHVPSTEIKGSDIFLKNMRDLIIKTIYPLSFTISRNLSHQDFLNKLHDHNIYLDELYFFNHGLASVEAMCSGLISIAGDNFNLAPYPERKIWPVNTLNLVNRIVELIELSDTDFMNLRLSVMNFAKNNHDHLRVCKGILELLVDGKSDSYVKVKDELTSLVS